MWTCLSLFALVALHGAQVSSQYAGAGPSWASSLERAKTLVQQMTLEELNNLTVGITTTTGCAGQSGGIAKHGYPGLCLNDGSHGVHATDFVNAYPAGMSTGASWNLDLAYRRGLFMGAEFKRKGAHVGLGPVVGPLGRVATGGRNWEGFAADPFLAGKMAAQHVVGQQQSVMASVKHLIGNEQETLRGLTAADGERAASSNINDLEMHELYLWPFVDAVHAGSVCVMSSYQRINGTHASENGPVQNGLLKDELAFPGFVLSDWTAQHSGLPTAIGGLDMAMPNSDGYWTDELAPAVRNGSLPRSRLEDMVTRILAAYYQVLGMEEVQLGKGLIKDLTAPHEAVDARDPASKPTLLQGAIEGHVLVKNTKNALPLRRPKMLSLYGYDATVPLSNYPTSISLSKWAYGIQALNISDVQALQLLLGTVPPGIEAATLGNIWNGGGSGANVPSYVSDPYSAIQQRAYNDDTFLFWDFASQHPFVDGATTACLVFINEFASEGYDRISLADSNSDVLVSNVASKCPNTIVVIHNAGIRLVDDWIDNPNITAVIYAHLPGQDGGRALTQILYGDVSPSGRLPYTVGKSVLDYGKLLNPVVERKNFLGDPQANFSDPSEIDYRYFLANEIEPRYAFGYGLTYSTFSYSGLQAAWSVGSNAASLPVYPPGPTVKVPGGVASLFDQVATVTLTVQNTGDVAAAEVPQLYVRRPGDDVQVLRGFAKEYLEPGQSARVTMPLMRRDLSSWDVVAQQWALREGTYQVLVGASVTDVKLMGQLVR